MTGNASDWVGMQVLAFSMGRAQLLTAGDASAHVGMQLLAIRMAGWAIGMASDASWVSMWWVAFGMGGGHCLSYGW